MFTLNSLSCPVCHHPMSTADDLYVCENCQWETARFYDGVEITPAILFDLAQNKVASTIVGFRDSISDYIGSLHLTNKGVVVSIKYRVDLSPPGPVGLGYVEAATEKPCGFEVSYRPITQYWCLDCRRRCLLDTEAIEQGELAADLACPYCHSALLEPMVWIEDTDLLSEMGCGGLGCDKFYVVSCPACTETGKDPDSGFPCVCCSGTGQIKEEAPDGAEERVFEAIIQSRRERGLPVPV